MTDTGGPFSSWRRSQPFTSTAISSTSIVPSDSALDSGAFTQSFVDMQGSVFTSAAGPAPERLGSLPRDDAFIIFNEREEAVLRADEGLRERGLGTYFWRNDIPIGQAWEGEEDSRLRRARAALVFLGAADWGPNHRLLADRAVALKKWIIPIVLDGAYPAELREQGSLFQSLRYQPLRAERWDEDLDALAALIRAGPRVDLDDQVRILKNGPDLARIRFIEAIPSGRYDQVRDRLVQRLLQALTENFSPERDPVDGERPLAQLAAARSWTLIALLRLDAEASDVRAEAERHLSPSYEPSEAVRFWTLGGLAQAQASYTLQAAKGAIEDPAPEVALLAQVLISGAQGVPLLRERLHADDYREQVWAALRVVRVLPFPELLDDLLDLLETAVDHKAEIARTRTEAVFGYDVLYALAQPLYAAAVAERLGADGPRVREMLILLVEICRDADEAVAWRFALLPAAFDDDTVEATFRATVANDAALAPTIERLRIFARSRRGEAVADPGRRPGYSPDVNDPSEDDLGIHEDVRTLTAVMMATKDAPPPVAIGLFGPWGSGKSFFMAAMKGEVERLSTSASDAYCRDVVSIDFNAWHYTDANLWASLVSHILERLAEYVSPKASPAEKQAAMIKDLASAKEAVDAVAAEQKAASDQLAARKSELVALKSDLHSKQQQLKNLTLGDLTAVFAANPAVQASLDKALSDLGAPASHETVAELHATVARANSLLGRTLAFTLGLIKDWRAGALLVAFIAAPALAALVYGSLKADLARIGTLVTALAAMAGAGLGWLNLGLQWMRKHLRALEAAKRKVDEVLEQRRKSADTGSAQLEAEIEELQTREAQTLLRMKAATERVGALETQLAEMVDGQSLARFLSDRTASDDYRRHLGLVSTARRDFEVLTERLAKPDPKTGKKVDRIILYIDDLDRCAETRVKDVLEAVHLLLAFKLFVVVVGVDSRWLTHSLDKVYGAFDEDGGAEQRRSTPQDYLEKIFQIIINLRPMSHQGFGRLMTRLLAAPTSADAPIASRGGPESGGFRGESAPPSVGTEEAATPLPLRNPAPRPSDPGTNTDQVAAAPSEPLLTDAERVAAAPEVAAQALAIHPFETEFAQAMHPFLSTPRAAKRFSNTYRLLKASVRAEALADYEGVGGPGEFRVPMTLLAILVGRSSAAPDVFDVLRAAAIAGADPVQALGAARPPSPLVGDVLHELRTLTTGDFPREAELYAYWLPRVERYGFPPGRLRLPVGRHPEAIPRPTTAS